MIEPLQVEAQAGLRHSQSQLDRRDLFDRVRFVQHREVVRKQKAAGLFGIIAAVRWLIVGVEQREEQGVVDHDQPRIGRRLAGFLEKAIAAWPAVARRAQVCLAAHLQPDFHLRLEIQVAQRAVAGRFRPLADRFQLVVFRAREKIGRLFEGAPQPQRAQIVLPSLEQYRRQLVAEDLPHDRDILPHQLLLQIDRVGGNDPLAVGLEGKARGRQQVGQRFSHARARFRHQRRSADQGLGHRHRQFLLLRSVGKVARLRQNPFARKRLPHRIAESGDWLAFADGNHLTGIPSRIGRAAKPQLRHAAITHSTARGIQQHCLPPAAAP